jgi:hypothetical protein
MQYLVFTSKGQTPGAIFVEWNIEADGQGTAGLWGMSLPPDPGLRTQNVFEANIVLIYLFFL